MNQKYLGAVIIVISVILFFVVYSFANKLKNIGVSQCACEGGTCPMSESFPIEAYIALTLIVLLGVFGVVLILMSRSYEAARIKRSKRVLNIIKTLDGDQKKIYNLIQNLDGVAFQSDLVEKSGFSKVKVTRILDKLEGKGLVERRRHGMSNVIVLKH